MGKLYARQLDPKRFVLRDLQSFVSTVELDAVRDAQASPTAFAGFHGDVRFEKSFCLLFTDTG